MNNKTLIITLLIGLSLLIPMANAAFSPGNVNVYLWTDETQYQPGDTITMHLTILNAATQDVEVRQVKIETPWFAYIRDHWEGNQTMQINKVIATGKSYSNTTTITIPDDSRATEPDTTIRINVTLITNPSGIVPTQHLTINVASPPITVRDINTLVLLQAILIILIVVCTGLIAAAIFLSARKPEEPYTQPPTSASSQNTLT